MSLEKTIATRASSGVLTNTFRTGYAVQISWSVNSQNIANNTSNVTVKAQLVSSGSAYTIVSSATKNGSLTINGTTYNFTFSASLSGGQTKTVFTKTVDIPHNSDGTKTFSMSTTLGIKVTLSGTFYDSPSRSGSGTLNTIPRTSSFTLGSSSLTLGESVAVNISKASSSFAHKIIYKFGSINTTVYSGTDSSYTLSRGVSDAKQIPTSTSGTATVTVETYTNTNYDKKVGSISKSLTIKVPSSVKPSIPSDGFTVTGVDSGASYANYGYIKGKTKAKLTISGATGSQGSTISSYSISGGGFSSTASSFTTGVLNTSGTITFTATVTDSRGRKSDAKTVTISVQNYNVPNITGYTVIRCNSSGTASNDGTYIKITPTYTYTTLGDKNTITSKAEFKQTSATTWTNAGAIASGSSLITGSNGIGTGNSYDVKFTITDKFTSVSKSVVIPTAFVTIDFKKGGKGIAFGKASETDNLVDIGMNLKVSGNGNTQISSTGTSVSWLSGCKGTGAIVNMTSQNGYSPILRQKTTNGAWAMGVYTNDVMYLTYMTDTNINTGNNTVTAQFAFPANVSGTVYTTGNKPTTEDISAIKGIYANSFWGISAPNGNATDWIRTTSNGIIPYQSGGASSLGTSSWQFNSIYGKTIYENGTALSSKYVRTDSASTIMSSGNALYIKASADGNATYIVGRHTDNANKWYVGSPNANYNVHLRSVSGSVVLRGSVINCKNSDDTAYVQINSSKFNVSSQEKWKTNIQEYGDSALEKILDTTIYNYDLTESNESAVGLVIERGVPQEIVSEMDCVSDVENTEMSTINEIEKDKGIDLYAMCALSWKAIQEQQEIIEKLKKRIEELETNNLKECI